MSLLKTEENIAWGPQGREVFERTYSRRKEDGSFETWFDTASRVVDGNLGLVPEEYHELNEREKLFDLIYNFRAIPAGRHLWTSGVPGRQFNRNCHRAGFSESLSEHFTFLFDELMKGGGVGANYSSEFLQLAPPILGEVDVQFRMSPKHPDYHELLNGDIQLNQASTWNQQANVWTIDDSREGWVDALGFLIDSYLNDEKSIVIFDLSLVRARGELIRGFGGTASGPGPLAEALLATAEVFNKVEGQHLAPLEAMAVDHAIAGCVVAGNIRRSARMSILHWMDDSIFEFIDCKKDHIHHWTTNISVEVDDAFFAGLADGNEHALKVFEKVTASMLHNGEPGFYNSSLASVGERADVRATNPCGEIALENEESCNLGHVNLSDFAYDVTGAFEAFRLMSRFLVRATFAPLTNEKQQAVEARNRRIGVGFFGFQEWLGELGLKYSESSSNLLVAELLSSFKSIVIEGSDSYADQLGIPRPIKHTTVAPTGTIAKLPGTTEGGHPVYARYYERRVRYAANDSKLVDLAKDHEIEDCIYSPDTKVVVFHTRDAILDKVDESLVEQANEISATDMLAVQAMIQKFYADNAVSFTVNIDPTTEIEELREAIRTNLPYLKGTTIMPDESRPQSPYTRISHEQWDAATDHEVGQGFDECASGSCPVR